MALTNAPMVAVSPKMPPSMRMKVDYMRNGQLKPAHNAQIGIQNQFIVGYSLCQKPWDTTHLDKLKQQLEKSLLIIGCIVST